MKFALFDTVVLLDDVPTEGLCKGAVGVVIEVLTKPNLAYLVEFCDSSGETLALPALLPEQLQSASAS